MNTESKMEPRKFEKMAAQGDALFMRIDKIPESAKPKHADSSGMVIVAHSETGHHHAFVHGGAMVFECDPPDPLVCYLRVESLDGATLEHLRPWDTHAPIHFAKGDYEIRRHREMTPRGWQRVED